jgi:hypothetical protein
MSGDSVRRMQPDELRATAAEYLRSAVARGRYPCGMVVADTAEYLHGYGDPGELRTLAWQLVGEPFAEHLAAQATWPERTDSDRLIDAFRILDAARIVAREDFACCQSCGSAEIGGEVLDEDEPRGYVFYHGQDADHAATGGGLWLSYGSFEQPDPTAVGEEIAEVLRAQGLPVEWDGSPARRIHVPLTWARRRHGRMAAFAAADPAEPTATVRVERGRWNLAGPVSAEVLAKVELPWLPAGVFVRIEAGQHEVLLHREHDRLVSDDGRSASRFDGLRLLQGDTTAEAAGEPELLEVTFMSLPSGESEVAGRPMILPEVLDTVRRLPTRTGSWLSAVSRSGSVIQLHWTSGRLWLETPHPADGTATGKEASLSEAETMLAILATEDRSAVAELDGVQTEPWR